ncbi:serine hydrolase [Streptomyces sp. NPDC004609]|uniref:serine hydrolase n=1 Tax=Streptomyces sp. NPDC004609 TaxID=3364704 RepID=UPI0036C35620
MFRARNPAATSLLRRLRDARRRLRLALLHAAVRRAAARSRARARGRGQRRDRLRRPGRRHGRSARHGCPRRRDLLPGRLRLYLDDPDAAIHDVTGFNPSVAGAAGEIISTAGDLNHFFGALLAGRVLPARQLAAMLNGVPDGNGPEHTRPAGPGDGRTAASASSYGLGFRSGTLSCGVTVWGHGGQVPGSLSRTAATRGGDHVLTLNRNGDRGDQKLEDAVLEAEFCGSSAAGRRPGRARSG